MTAAILYTDPETLRETALELAAQFERNIPCQGEGCFKAWCDHPRKEEEFTRNLRYDWESFLWSREAAAPAA